MQVKLPSKAAIQSAGRKPVIAILLHLTPSDILYWQQQYTTLFKS